MKRPALLTSTFLVASLIYLFFIGTWVAIQSFSNLMEKWGHRSEMTVYLRPESSSADIEKLKTFLNQYSQKLMITYQSPESIRKNLKKLMPKSQNHFAHNEDFIASIPPHFILKSSSNFFGSSLFQFFDSIHTELQNFSFVESTSYGKSWIEKYMVILESFQNITLIFLTGLSLTLILVIGNSIRAHIHSRREEIAILELVGATPSMIRKPFLIEGTLLSLISMGLSLGIITLIIALLRSEAMEMFKLLDFQTALYSISLTESLFWLSLSAAIGFFGSFLCLAEINTGWSAANYQRKKIFNVFHRFFNTFLDSTPSSASTSFSQKPTSHG